MARDESFYSMRKDYTQGHIERADLNDDPLAQFELWLNEAIEDDEVIEANIMTLATATPDGRPSSRQVLLKSIVNGELIWFTNYDSRKGRELTMNPYASLLFFWEPLQRQVRIEGKVSRISREKSIEYFAERPRGSQIAATASAQSKEIKLYELHNKVESLETEYEGREIPCPENWGGYALDPERWEFWQGGPNRLHDRFIYLPGGNSWKISRLSP